MTFLSRFFDSVVFMSTKDYGNFIMWFSGQTLFLIKKTILMLFLLFQGI